MRVLVTGGAGFIGSHVVDQLRAAGHEARIFDVRPSPHHPPGGVETVIGDLLDPAAVRKAMRDCDAVAHLAAAADVNAVAKDPAAAEELNARGTLNVLEAARAAGVRRVIYASTIWVYSDAVDAEVDEESGLQLPRHLYTATKLAGEMYCRSYAELYGLEYTILRFGIPYGPRARPAAVLPAFVRRALAGEPMQIAGTGEQSRRFVYVEDLADGVIRALRREAANRIYNLVGDEDVTVRDIATAVQRAVCEAEVVHVPGRTGDFDGAVVCGERAHRELGWQPSTTFQEGVARYVAWHREAEDAPAPVRSHWRWPVRENARRVGMAAVFASTIVALAAALAWIGELHSLTEPGDTATLTLLLVFPPLLLVTGFGGSAEGWRALSRLCWTVAVAEVVAVLAPWPPGLAHTARPHAVLLMVGALATGAAGTWASAERREATERPSDFGA
jgi:UDP-glucose 4-epimerase